MQLRRLAIAAIVAMASLPAAPARAAGQSDVERIDLVPVGATSFAYGRWEYGGSLEIRPRHDGLVLIEHTDVDSYLAGIREVPFTWPEETLAAQVVAARTYLAWTLHRGRAGAGRTYGFDICASTACQVYAGNRVTDAPDGERWLEAVERTAGEILVYADAPAQTLYSSSAGPRTRAVQDIWGGPGVPYLVPVDSPEEGVSPYWEWEFELPVDAVGRILAAAGYRTDGDIRAVRVSAAEEGSGQSTFDVATARGLVSVALADVRWVFNSNGPRLYPGLLPASRPDGRRWPQSILSYTFDAAYEPPADTGVPDRLASILPAGELPPAGVVTFSGTGWGHGVGMSQWGAEAMGDAGADYAQILAHYYGGLLPTPGHAMLPDEVSVGLDWKEGEIGIGASGSFELWINGVRAALMPGGDWTIRLAAPGIVIVPPARYGGVAIEGLLERQWPR